MSASVEAWVLHVGAPGAGSSLEDGSFARERIEIGEPIDDELLVEPLYASWEGNLDHALARRPIDVCAARGEVRLVLGNAGVVRVLRAGPGCVGLREGDLGMVFVGGTLDEAGYSKEIYAYDAPHTVGLLAKRTKLRAHNFIPIPAGTEARVADWAAFSIRYVTAWSNWRVAFGTYRLQMTERDEPRPHVWAWSGGTPFAELDLARRAGCQVTMVSGRDAHLATLARLGIPALDRRRFPHLELDERRAAADPDYRHAQRRSEAEFLAEVRARTDGRGVSIFLDYVGGPLWRATLRSLARQGVVTTAGWMQGMILSINRALECIGRHTHVHTHYARRSEAEAAMAYGLAHEWMPKVTEVYEFDAVPECAAASRSSATQTYFPVVRVNAP